ncbi:BZ3500_MvSof-1268-A1-R1_Chr3-1g05631 [Microbotryum saponariae]|uniref:BZ3500_MvSof-1268-A1-R1_Chr3-1g05631 protein n=1 Tax=Microbotryum saponariae TaxID=289078 RepID=A0A2X0LRE0_9BASI|nr:BZ3500_MvSof-1268-A1-R1_Chr3-1g05631 [Microbotryum saponariae]SDA04821.1 BZ3501_MvSof-1269-A2-R1_Chr3-1g05301 [Microbotryum saponariae]
MTCISTTNDTNNCGAIGTICSSSNASRNATALACVDSICKATACSPKFHVEDGVCVKNIDTTSDMNNCGGIGKVCSTSYTNGVGGVCSNSVCQPELCNTGFAFNYATSKCINSMTDNNNCGAVGKVCSFPYGSGSCIAGTCLLSSCNTNYYNIKGICTYIDLTSNSNNCGAVGNKCSFSNGLGKCITSDCTYTSCSNGFALINNTCVAVDYQTDMNNCGSSGNTCQSTYLNGGSGSCVQGQCFSVCVTGYTWDATHSICRVTSSDVYNCGAIGNICSPLGSLPSICSNSQCYASACLPGFELIAGVCYKIDTTSNVNNCGALGAVCSFYPVGASGVCTNSKCVITTCPANYSLSTSGVCVAAAVSQRPRVAKRKVVKRTPCPKGETPCPIKASASFELAVTQHFTVPHDEYTGIFAGLGGYECLDTRESLESCGGCSSTDEGQDCTVIKGGLGVGCDNGSCVVFSCKEGWKSNARGTKCIRAKNNAQPNATRNAAAAVRKREAAAAHPHHHIRALHQHSHSHASSL